MIMTKLLGNRDKGIPFIVSAPAGTGKNTLVDMLIAEFSTCVKESVSSTTRKRREGEIDGVHYHFMSSDDFAAKVLQGEFLEHAEVFGNYYGTCRNHVENGINAGCHIFLVIDTNGAMMLREKKFPGVFIFISPPSREDLEKRLLGRGTETVKAVRQRLEEVDRELEAASCYDYNIINDDLKIAYQVLKSIVVAEEHKICGE